jgi:hypothetical protein
MLALALVHKRGDALDKEATERSQIHGVGPLPLLIVAIRSRIRPEAGRLRCEEVLPGGGTVRLPSY